MFGISPVGAGQTCSRPISKARRWTRARKNSRAVSDVVATILLLALTVTLFAAIFGFVSTFPSPPAQNANQFSSSLWISGSDIVGLNITHLAGPSVPGNALIFLHSANNPAGPPTGCVVFSGSTTVSAGISTSVWSLGQVWSEKFSKFTGCSGYAGDPIPDNITVYIVSQSDLIYSVILPGAQIALPPQILATWTYPATPISGTQFTVNASVSGIASGTKPYLNLAALYAAGSSQKMTYNAATGQWYFTVLSSNTSGLAAGTYLGFVNVTGAHGGTATAAVSVVIVSSTSNNGPLSVAVIFVPSPPNSGTKETVQAVVTYTGSLKNAALNVSFWGNETSPTASNLFKSWGASGLTISGPSTVTVPSSGTWTIPAPPTTLNSYRANASATVTGVASVTGTLSFTPALITDSPTSGRVGNTTTITGSAFAASTGVTFSFGGVAVTPSSCSTGTLSGSTVTTTSSGGFTCVVPVPAVSPGVAASILATDASSGQNDSTTYTVTTWTVSLSPTSGDQDNSTTATGAGFEASTGVTFTFDGVAITPASCSTGTLVGSTVTTTAGAGGGKFVCVLTVPYGVASGASPVVATDSTSGQTASASYSVSVWSISLSPTTGSHSSTVAVTITGTGFAPSSLLSLSINGTVVTPSSCSPGTLSGSTITAALTGRFVCTYTLAKAAAAGIYTFSVTDFTSGQSATAYFSRT